MNKTAILLGATGLTGSKLLELLLDDERFQKVIILTRRTTNIDHEKLEEHIVDLLSLDNYKDLFRADVVFCCIGTTKAKTPDKMLYHKIDYGIPVTAARLAKENNIPVFVVVSSLGADPVSRFFYNRTKGEMERDVLKQNIKNTFILRPSLISGDRREKRGGENIAEKIMRILNVLIPDKYKIISAIAIAKAMHRIAQDGYDSSVILSDEIRKLGKNKESL